MHSHAQLLALVQSGVHPTITFTKECLELEGYEEPGMKARVLAAVEQPHDILKVTVDFTPFEVHNKTLETANFYGKDGKPNCTAREAGCYKGTEDFYVPLDEVSKETEYFTIDSDERSALFAQFQAEGSPGTYVAWLEDKVRKLTRG